MRLVNPRAVIVHLHHCTILLRINAYMQLTRRVSVAAHGVQAVDDEVYHHLLELDAIAGHLG
ncbi:hypothetical protein D3C81_2294760 [compost metagenome]